MLKIRPYLRLFLHNFLPFFLALKENLRGFQRLMMAAKQNFGAARKKTLKFSVKLCVVFLRNSSKFCDF